MKNSKEIEAEILALQDWAKSETRSLNDSEKVEIDEMFVSLNDARRIEALDGFKIELEASKQDDKDEQPARRNLNAFEVGAYSVGPDQFDIDVVKKFGQTSAIINAVSADSLISTSHGRDYHVGTIALGAGETRTEGQAGTADGTTPYTSANLAVAVYGSKQIFVSHEMLRDSEFSVETELTSLGIARAAALFDSTKTASIVSGATAVTGIPAAPLLAKSIATGFTGIAPYVRRNVKVMVNNATYGAFLAEDDNGASVFAGWRALGIGLDDIIVNDTIADNAALVGNFDEGLAVRVVNPPLLDVLAASGGRNYELRMSAGVIVRNADAIAYIIAGT